ncbi:TonB-dependent receptor [Nibricoccus aquaticus]|uniref:TonB-dependent receptor n=1 Tax=Nibricoccus aquaticus TaxID=2576891 RepID=A0A290Q5M0_9BACT|nr:TonB-dependent receptor [Nibricoccus aquaticus]ATC63794.1 TonB-dependent receptor [Nibricoccus aquaticus]
MKFREWGFPAVVVAGVILQGGGRAVRAQEVEVLSRLVVSASRAPQMMDEVPLAVRVVDGERLRVAMGVDVALREETAFGLFRRTSSVAANPTAQGVSLRGIGPSGASRSLVLLDGVPLNDPFGGWVSWSAVPRMSLGGAQIVSGGGSSVWGSAALSGVVALESVAVETERQEVRAEFGGFEMWRGEAAVTRAVGGGFLRVDVEAFSTEGFYALKEADRGAVDRALSSEHRTARVAWSGAVSEHVRANVTGRFFEEERGNGTAMQGNATRAGFVSAAIEGEPRPGLSWAAVAYGQRQSFESFFTTVNATRSAETPANDQFEVPATAAGTSASVTWKDSDVASMAVGGDVRWVEGETREDFLFQAGQLSRRRFAGGEQIFAGAFVHHDRRIAERWRASVDVRADFWENADGRLREVARASGAVVAEENFATQAGMELSPRAGLVWKASEAWRVRGAVYRAFRVPTLNEYYRPFRVGTVNTLANADLKRETLTGGEVGTEFTRGAWRLEATGFWNELEDAVGNVTLSTNPALTTRQRQNLDTVRVSGVELGAGWRVVEALELRAGYLWSDAEVTEARAQASLVGKRLAQAPEHKATASVDWRAPGGLNVRVAGRYTSEQFEDDENALVLREAVTVDLRVEKSWRVRAREGRRAGLRLTVFAAVENVFDEDVVTSRSATGLLTYDAPRWVRGGVRVAW